MNEKDKTRFALLSAKSASGLTDDEKSELKTLAEKAEKSDLTWDSKKGEVVSKQKSLSVDGLREVIVQGCKTAFGDLSDEKIKSIVKEVIDERFPAEKQKDASLTQDIVQELMDTSLEKAQEAVEKSAPDAVITIDLKAAFENSVKKLRPASKMRHNVEIPFSGNAGNLTVCEKQILNVCLGKGMNEGISESQIQQANTQGMRRYEAMVEKSRYAGGLIDRAEALSQLTTKTPSVSGQIRDLFEQAGIIQKTLTTGGTGTGEEFIPTDLSAELYTRMFLESRLAQRMAAAEVNMPTAVFEFPLSTTRPTWKLTGEGVDAIKSDPGTGDIALTAKKLTGYVEMAYEMEEDSIIPMLPFLRQQLGESGAAAYEEVLISGDTAATHQDSDTHAVGARHVAKAWDGFRKLALAGSVTTSFATGGISKTNFRALRKSMGKYGLRPSQLIILAGINGVNDIMGLSEVYTRDTFGRPVLEAGDIQRYENIEIIPSELMREDLNASGVYDGTTTTEGSILLINTTRFVTGRRRAFTLEMDRSIINQTRWLVASFRKAFSPVEAPSATVPSVALGYNYDA